MRTTTTLTCAQVKKLQARNRDKSSRANDAIIAAGWGDLPLSELRKAHSASQLVTDLCALLDEHAALASREQHLRSFGKWRA